MRRPHTAPLPSITSEVARHSLDTPRKSGLFTLLGMKPPISEQAPLDESIDGYDMNVALSYGINWSLDKCGRDAFQNFFDANGGTLDGVRVSINSTKESSSDPIHRLTISGNEEYDYKKLLVIGATSKRTGEHTAGGFGEGAKFLALSLLRDHGVNRIIYRSQDWQLEYFIGDLPSHKVTEPTKGLFARVTTGHKQMHGSTMQIFSTERKTIERLEQSKQLFRSSENPDFQHNSLEVRLPGGTEMGIKFLGFDDQGSRLEKGHLYVAGQRRHFSQSWGKTTEWNTVRGITVWTTKDTAPGDRDRGEISSYTLQEEIFKPFAERCCPDQIARFVREIEPVYAALNKQYSELNDFTKILAQRAEQLDVKVSFDQKYIAAKPLMPDSQKNLLINAGYVLCPYYFTSFGMKSSNEAMASLHNHLEVTPSQEQAARLGIAEEAVDLFICSSNIKEFHKKPIKLYSREAEHNPTHGTAGTENIWVAVEHLSDPLTKVIATILHEMDHEYGGDSSAEFSYALTDTLEEVINAIVNNPSLSSKLTEFATQWKSSLDREKQ